MPEPPAILFVSTLYPPQPGGAERHTQRLAEALWRHGHRARVLTTPARGVPGDAGLAPVWRLPVPPSPPWRDVGFALWVTAQLVILRPRYQIVQWVMTGLHVLIGMPVAAALGMKNILMLAGCGEGRRLLERPRGRKLLGILHRHADRIVILNPAMQQELLDLQFPAERLVTLPCGADPEIFHPSGAAEWAALRARWELAEDGPVIVFTGRFVEAKRLPDLIDAFARLTPRHPRAVLVLAGDGPLGAELAARASAAGLARRVRFPGMLPPAQVAEVLRLADVYVLPSATEGIPCSLVEAIASGLPAVVSDIPGTGMLVRQGVTGLRVTAGDVPSLAAAIENLLGDPGARERMGRAGRALFLENYTVDRVREGYERVYTELVGAEMRV
jgi:glycosyltransferase involved in cell wall biosynthesis